MALKCWVTFPNMAMWGYIEYNPPYLGAPGGGRTSLHRTVGTWHNRLIRSKTQSYVLLNPLLSNLLDEIASKLEF
jgi:hypothetical protein